MITHSPSYSLRAQTPPGLASPRALLKRWANALFRRDAETAPRQASRASVGASSTTRSRAGDSDSRPGRINIDLTDVLNHAIWHETCAGIPRVQLEVASALMQANPSARAFGRHRAAWRDLGPLLRAAVGDVDVTFALLRETFADVRLNAAGVRLLLQRRRRKLALAAFEGRPELGPNDRLFIGGAFWIDDEIVTLCKEAAANGAYLAVLFHDLIPLTLPAFTGHDFTRQYREVLRLPAHFIVTTELNRSDLKAARRSMGGASARIVSSVAPLADEFPGARRNEAPTPAPERFWSLEGAPFVLCVGTIEIRKNQFALMTAWEELGRERDDLPRLVIAGRRGWKATGTLDRLDRLPPRGPIMFAEAPSDAELRWLYASCLFTAFPSFFEGWGLPVGESFWFGKPCAVSDAPSIAPVARDLAVPFSPYHVEDMKTAFRRLLDPREREERQRLIEAAPLRTWSDFAKDVATILTECRPTSEKVAARGESADLDARAA